MTAEYTEDPDGGYFNCWSGRYTPDKVCTLDLYMAWRDGEEFPALATFPNLTAVVVPWELLTPALVAEIDGTGVVSLEVTMMDDENDLPSGVFELPRLQMLELSGGLARLPDRFAELPALTWLSLAHNTLTELPASVLAARLLDLDVSFNNMTRVPRFAAGSPLEALDLTANPIAVLDADELPRGLEELRAMCELTAVRGDFARLTRLGELALGTGLRELPDLRGLTGLTEIQLAGPLGEALFERLPTSLEIIKNYGSHDLGLTRIPPAIGRLTRLRVLELACQKIEALADELRGVPLERLQLTSNPLGDTPTYDALPATLQVLELVNVGMTRWPQRLCELAELQTLLVYLNKMGPVPDAVRALPQLSKIEAGETGPYDRG